MGEAVSKLKSAEVAFSEMSAPTIVDPDWVRREEGLWFDKSLIYTLANDVRQATEAHDTLLRPGAEEFVAVPIGLHRAALRARTDPKSGLEEALRLVAAVPPERRTIRFWGEARMPLDVIPHQAAALPAARELRALTAGT
ncbi:hypothetical protein [Actinomadura macra]|uniref:hypothetical protein n=1 Tax=Actinomadura macra TaxID=46164 RepID=UPI0008340C40|nr:hypothetical protein [Actinomadura macra]